MLEALGKVQTPLILLELAFVKPRGKVSGACPSLPSSVFSITPLSYQSLSKAKPLSKSTFIIFGAKSGRGFNRTRRVYSADCETRLNLLQGGDVQHKPFN